ncbi:Thioredoxin-like fold [Naviculisporaceae sp. PSN 640]
MIQPGQLLPNFTLPDLTGTEVSITALIGHGSPVLITFYRGGWCPFDNLTLRSLQCHLDEFDAMGCALVAISPETPANLAKTAERKRMQFPVLSDPGNQVAKKLGIVWTMPEYLRPVCKQCLDLGKWNGVEGEGEYELPIPASLLVDGRGIVRKLFVDLDYRKRLDTNVALDWVDELLKEEEERGKRQRVYSYQERKEEMEEAKYL